MSDDLPSIGGNRMERSIADFTQACRVLLRDEQEKLSPNNALISVLCDSVRLCREYEALATGRASAPASPAPASVCPACANMGDTHTCLNPSVGDAYGREIAEREARGEVAVGGRWVKPPDAARGEDPVAITRCYMKPPAPPEARGEANHSCGAIPDANQGGKCRECGEPWESKPPPVPTEASRTIIRVTCAVCGGKGVKYVPGCFGGRHVECDKCHGRGSYLDFAVKDPNQGEKQ